MTGVTAYQRLGRGDLDAIFAEDGKRKNRTDLRPTTRNNFRLAQYGSVIVRMQDNADSTRYQISQKFGEQRPKWFWCYREVDFGSLQSYWNKPVDLDYVTSQGQRVCFMGVKIFECGFGAAEIVPTLKRCGIEKVRLMTFNDPFFNEGDRMAFHAEWL